MTTTLPGVHFAVYNLLSWIIIGALAGFFASVLVRGRGYGCLGNTIVGLVGAVIGGYSGEPAEYHWILPILGHSVDLVSRGLRPCLHFAGFAGGSEKAIDFSS